MANRDEPAMPGQADGYDTILDHEELDDPYDDDELVFDDDELDNEDLDDGEDPHAGDR
jgi:hypothetical protein